MSIRASLGVLVLLTVASCRVHQIRDPIVVPGTGDLAKNATAVQQTVEAPTGRDPKLWWFAESREQQKWALKYQRQDHVAMVTVTWDDKDIQIHYRDSAGLKYDAAKRSISDTYNSWVQNLAQEIERQVAKLR
jgi:hypothetical protein